MSPEGPVCNIDTASVSVVGRIARKGQRSRGLLEHASAHSMSRRFVLVLIALLSLMVLLPSFANIYTEWLWFGETGYQSVFLTSLATKGVLGGGHQGRLEGFVALGFNPLLAGPDVPRLFEAMAKLKWKVVIDPFMLDSAEFWKAPGQNPAEIDTEVLYLPSSHWIERDGSFTNSGRWAQWKEKAVDPPIGVRSDTWILSELFWRVKELYQEEGGAYNDPIQHLTWDYLNPREPTLVELAKEINGYDRTSGQLLSSFGQLKDDGTTSAGNWIYAGSYTEAGNQMARRGTADPTGLGMHPRLGLQLAAQPARAIQPRVSRRGRQALGPAASGHRLERPRVDWRCTRLRTHDSA